MQKPKTYIIEEDEHLENLGKIIQRDFFPNSAKVQQQQKAIPLNINEYLKHFKSNENHIFAELVHTNAEEWKKDHDWMEKGKQLMLESDKNNKPFTNMIKRDPILKQINFGVTQQESLNGVFFSSDKKTVSFNSIEHEKAKKVYYDNTRIESEEIERSKIYEKKFIRDHNLEQIPQTPVLEGRRHDMRVQSDYSLKRVPSPEPERLPIMTWGEVSSTPLRIGEEVQFQIQDTSNREKLLNEMTAKIIKQKQIKKNQKDDLKLKILSSARMKNSSYRKVSTVRQKSEKRFRQKSEKRFSKFEEEQINSNNFKKKAFGQ